MAARDAAPCRCDQVSELHGQAAASYVEQHLVLVERGRDPDGVEDYQCPDRPVTWILDYPSRHWAADHRGEARLRRLPLPPGAPPAGGPWQ